MSNEITRVARAIAERALVSSRHPWPAPNHPDWIDLACAAIDAMTSRHRPGEIERLRARVEALEKTLKHAASVSHNGGLVGFSEHDALIAVRKLTLAYWGREHGEAARATVIAALEAQP
jgi:hypothetical protein